MRRVSLVWLAALIMACVATDVRAQSIVGTVRDSTGRPLREAEVIVEPSGVRTRSDSSGRFVLRVARSGVSTLRVRLVGYRFFEEVVRIPSFGTVRRDIRLSRLPQRLAAVTILDRTACSPTTLSGFECRRDAGVGHFRDAGDLRALKPRYWAEMLDGMPGLRREMRPGPHGMEWRPVAPPSRCVRELWNGQAPMEVAGDAPFLPDEYWKPVDVVAIEYYEEHRNVPAQYQRFAWYPLIGGQPCGLIVYWLRGRSSMISGPAACIRCCQTCSPRRLGVHRRSFANYIRNLSRSSESGLSCLVRQLSLPTGTQPTRSPQHLASQFCNDMLHIALATVAGADVVASWNFRHLVRFDRIRLFNAVNLEAGYTQVAIHSPREIASDDSPTE